MGFIFGLFRALRLKLSLHGGQSPLTANLRALPRRAWHGRSIFAGKISLAAKCFRDILTGFSGLGKKDCPFCGGVHCVGGCGVASSGKKKDAGPEACAGRKEREQK